MALTKVSRGLLSTSIEDNGNATAITIDSSENVGIGTSSPSAPMHVNRSGVGEAIRFTDSSTDTGHLDVVSGGGCSLWAGGFLAFGAGGGGSYTERMRIDSSGNVQIGTGTPAYLVSTSDIAQLSVNRVGTSGAITNASRSAAFINVNGANGGSSIEFSTASANNTQPTERMRIDSSGNLLVGRTASTSAKLHLENATDVHMDMNSVGDNRGKIGSKTNDFYIGHSSSAANIIFKRNIGSDDHPADSGNETMRIDSSGNLLVGTTDTNVFDNTSGNGIGLRSGGEVQIAVDSGETLYLNRMGTDGRVINFRKAGSFVSGIDVTSTTVTYNTSSDQRLKENIADADDAGSKIDAIQVRKFDWKADGSHQDYGMIAQELQTVAPEAVSGDADSEEMMGVDYSKLVPMLIKEIQSLRNRVAQLEE